MHNSHPERRNSKMEMAAATQSCTPHAGRLPARGKPFEPAAAGRPSAADWTAAGRTAARREPFEPANGGSSGQAIVCAVSYFSFPSSVARRGGGNSCSTGQNWSRLTEIALNLYQLRRTGSVQVLGSRCGAIHPEIPPAAGESQSGIEL